MGRDGCPRALDLCGVDGRADRRAVPSAIRYRGGGAGSCLAVWVAGAGALLLRGGPDRVRSVSGGGRGRCRVPGDRAVENGARQKGPAQVRSSRYRSAAQAVDGRRAHAGRGPVGDVRGGPRSRQGARAGQGRSDALPTPALQAAAAPRPGVGPHRLDEGAPRVAGIADLRAGQHGTGVHRQSRRVRRADRTPCSARRAALWGCARSGVLADRPPTQGRSAGSTRSPR